MAARERLQADGIRSDVTAYYSGKLAEHGPTPRGVDWKDAASQHARFDALLTLVTDPAASLLDVGCGLGGGAIFWAQEFGARVTGVTIAPSHIDLVREFAKQAGVESRVQVQLCDALAMPGDACFDSAVAIDSAISFPRSPWFRHLERLLRPEGRVFIFDCFLGRSEYEEPFNRHWCSQIGTIEEYAAAARGAGFTLMTVEDVSLRAVHFWTRTLAVMSMEAGGGNANASEAARLEQSLRLHALVRRGLLDGGLRHAFLSFARR